VEVGDVLADEMDLLHRLVGHEAFIVHTNLAEVVLQRGQVADRCIQPDVEILARRIRDLDAEVGRVTADVPVAQAALAFFVFGEPFLDLVQHLGLQAAGGLRPLLQKGDTAWITQLEEVVLRALHDGRGAGQHGEGMDQLGGRVDRAADLAGVAVLVLGVALRAFALDEAVRQEHGLLGVEELLDGFHLDQLVLAQRPVDLLGQLVVLRAVGGVPVVKGDVEAIEVGLAASGDIGDESLWRDAGFLGGNHDGRAMRIVGTHEMHCRTAHALEAHPDIGLGVLHDVANMEIGVRVRQGGGDEELAGHGGVRSTRAGIGWREARHFMGCGAQPGDRTPRRHRDEDALALSRVCGLAQKSLRKLSGLAFRCWRIGRGGFAGQAVGRRVQVRRVALAGQFALALFFVLALLGQFTLTLFIRVIRCCQSAAPAQACELQARAFTVTARGPVAAPGAAHLMSK